MDDAALTVEPRAAAKQEAAGGWRGALMLVFAFPKVIWFLMVLEVLDHYRLNGLNFVQYQYVVNEFGFSDLDAGRLLGYKGTVRGMRHILPASPKPERGLI